jgi:hypothetical protein
MHPHRKAFPRHARGPLMVATNLHRRQEHGIWGGLASLLRIFSLVPVAHGLGPERCPWGTSLCRASRWRSSRADCP